MTGKARGLELLMQNKDLGYQVPKFEVIDIPIQARKCQLNYPIIARSSSLHEDGSHSFAGIYESHVAHDPVELRDAVGKVFASFNSRKAKDYRAEHGITDDKMQVILQEFIDARCAGVMYTSNPTYPEVVTIEYRVGRSRIDPSSQTFIVDKDKSGHTVFMTEGMWLAPMIAHYLSRVGVELERRLGPLDIEFVSTDADCKPEEIYLVQARKITDLEWPKPVEIPEYSEEQFLGKTKVKRGTGALTLPVVIAEDMHQGFLMSGGDMFLSHTLAEGTFNILERANEAYKEGYILVTPHFDDSTDIVGREKGLIDRITSNKKAVITTRFSTVSSHIMTIARERGIAYAGFDNVRKFQAHKLNMGDLVSIYFKGREAFVYLEEKAD